MVSPDKAGIAAEIRSKRRVIPLDRMTENDHGLELGRGH
jgi:hypothetical protein